MFWTVDAERRCQRTTTQHGRKLIAGTTEFWDPWSSPALQVAGKQAISLRDWVREEGNSYYKTHPTLPRVACCVECEAESRCPSLSPKVVESGSRSIRSEPCETLATAHRLGPFLHFLFATLAFLSESSPTLLPLQTMPSSPITHHIFHHLGAPPHHIIHHLAEGKPVQRKPRNRTKIRSALVRIPSSLKKQEKLTHLPFPSRLNLHVPSQLCHRLRAFFHFPLPQL